MITDQIFQWARSQPERPALIFNDNPVSYAVLWRLIEAARRFFAQQQLTPGQTAAVLAQDLLDSWVLVMGLRAVGVNTVAIQYQEQAQNLGIKHLACFVVTQPLADPRQLTGDADTRIIIVPAATFAGCQSGELAFDAAASPVFGSHLLYTSGTTGVYRKVIISAAAQQLRNVFRARSRALDSNTMQHVFDFPLWTGMGFSQPSAVWHAGGCVVIDQRPERFSNFFKYPINKATLVPGMLKHLLDAKGDAAIPVHGFELVVIAGALSYGLAEDAARRLTKNIETLYSATELGNYAMHSHYKGLDDLLWMTPAAERVVEIVDEDGMQCPTGQQGEIRVLITDIDSSAYLDDEEAGARVFRDGYFYPGDMAVARADGRIRIMGRSADVLNVQGNKLAVAPMEQVLQRHLGIDEVCLFSGLNEQGEEELVIAIQSDHAPQQTGLQALHPNFKLFEKVRVEVLKEFPRAQSGMRKIQRAALRKLVFSGR